MTSNNIHQLSIAGETVQHVAETHISWVVLTGAHAYKIKKPLQFSFLDFSTLEKRQFYCQRELTLNRRLASDIYLDVVPVKKTGSRHHIGPRPGAFCDYAVQMKKLDPALEMHRLLEAGRVTPTHIAAIARKLAPFHAKAEVIRRDFDAEGLKSLFNDLESALPVVEQHLSKADARTVKRAMAASNRFIDRHRGLFEKRIEAGLVRDVHGDLHSGNIFLCKPPVIFDCIEFNDAFRQIDLLDEVAFFCMDLEAWGQPALSAAFLQCYRQALPTVITSDADQRQLTYYQLYRANVRAKVEALEIPQLDDRAEIERLANTVRAYLQLMEGYLKKLGV